MKAEIRQVGNGFILVTCESTSVYEENEDSNGNYAFQRMIYDLMIHFGVDSSKHDKERIEVKIVHGGDYDCKDKDCKICKAD